MEWLMRCEDSDLLKWKFFRGTFMTTVNSQRSSISEMSPEIILWSTSGVNLTQNRGRIFDPYTCLKEFSILCNFDPLRGVWLWMVKNQKIRPLNFVHQSLMCYYRYKIDFFVRWISPPFYCHATWLICVYSIRSKRIPTGITRSIIDLYFIASRQLLPGHEKYVKTNTSHMTRTSSILMDVRWPL